MKGQTLHSLLQLPIRGTKCAELKGKSLQRLQNQLEGIQYLIIDEYSVIGQKMRGCISRCCKQATGKYTVPFGGISVVLVGDIGQLPPITDKVVYHCKPCDELSTEGFCAYQKFDNVVKFTVNERAKGASSDQETFRQLQLNTRDGNSSANDWQLLLTRTPSNVQNIHEFESSTVKLTFGNEKVATYNYEKLRSLKKPIAVVNAKHNNTTAAKLQADDIGSLQPTLLLTKGARVMLTRNLWTDVGLCNGTMGTVIDIIYSEGSGPPALPIAAIVQFDDSYIGPSIFEHISNCVPIKPVISTSDTLGSNYERQQLPLTLSWSITIHKSQGLTLKKVWTDLGLSENIAGLAYVALSRVKNLQDLIIEPMTLERLQAVEKSSNFQFRIQEEARFHNLFEATVNKY